MPQSKEVHREYMRMRRQGSQDITQGSQKGVTHLTKDIIISKEKAAKLLLICHSLDRVTAGIDGPVNLLEMVRFGVQGPTMSEIKDILDG